ncbi:MAG: CNP1-like family protein [Burkholderiales bacterium]|nr:CNP1-like family protein [Burkholderiales bacterium]
MISNHWFKSLSARKKSKIPWKFSSPANTVLQLALILCVTACTSQSKFFDTLDYKKDWDTIQSGLPAYPQPENLLEFDAGPAANLRYFIDAKSISVDEKRVIRYSMVAQSPQGASNVSYEGLRCETRERKRYATGNNDTRTWVRAGISEWQPLERVSQLQAQRELAKFYFCPRGLVVGSSAEAIRALKAGVHPMAIR